MLGTIKFLIFYISEFQSVKILFQIQNSLNIVVSHKINILAVKFWL